MRTLLPYVPQELRDIDVTRVTSYFCHRITQAREIQGKHAGNLCKLQKTNLGQLCRAADLYCPRMLLAAAAGGAKGSRCFGKRPSKTRLKRKKSRSGRQIVVKRLRGGLFVKIKSPESVGTQGFQWSCRADSNRRPHPYQAPLELFSNYLLCFMAISAPIRLLSAAL